MTDLFFAVFIRYGSSFFSLLTSLYIARQLGAEDFGNFSLLIFICTAGASVLSLSVQRTVLMFISNEVEKNVQDVFSAYFTVAIVSAVLSFIISLFYTDFLLAIIISISVAGIQWQLFSSSLAVVNENYLIKKNQLFFFVGRASCLLSAYVFSFFYSSYYVYLLIFSICLVVPLFLEVLLVYKKYLLSFELNMHYITDKIKKSKWMHLDTIFSQLIIFSSSFVLSQANSQPTESLGMYNLSQQIVISSLIVVSVFQIYISRIIKDKIDKRSLNLVVVRFFQFSFGYFFLLILVSTFFYFNYEIIGAEFKQLYFYVFCMSFAGVFSLGSKVMLPVFMRLGETKFISITTMFSGSLSLLLSFYLINSYGAYGAVASFCLGYFISFIFFLYKFLGVLKYER
ncbi:hypothetical protein H4J63_07160 [Pseudoalteromonas sp. 5Ae-yellow]|uniref:hypothetical protein n=1 Tax=Pseudoalteromonas sp. 5Ae-yellow TaxID=2759847 RepID=UPI0015F5B919|nr:hypothetical protein [Pseudoalteromonas sp. 5Ae-yellow]MBA6409123.1 hypothetical protein [Pseudoalteromonas sp. 5Ae-yellow]